jgi:hypothetical protein
MLVEVGESVRAGIVSRVSGILIFLSMLAQDNVQSNRHCRGKHLQSLETCPALRLSQRRDESAGLVELTVQHTRRQKRGVLGATEGGTEPYSMYGEYRTDRATTKSDAFHGASTNPAIFQNLFHFSFFYLDTFNEQWIGDRLVIHL